MRTAQKRRAQNFEYTPLQFAQTAVADMEDSFNAGAGLADALEHDGLVHVFVVSDGLNVNGSALAKGRRSRLPADVAVTGGLAGDQGRFRETVTFLDEVPDKKTMTGFYSCGEMGPVGPDPKQAELHHQTLTITTFSEPLCRS